MSLQADMLATIHASSLCKYYKVLSRVANNYWTEYWKATGGGRVRYVRYQGEGTTDVKVKDYTIDKKGIAWRTDVDRYSNPGSLSERIEALKDGSRYGWLSKLWSLFGYPKY